MSVRFLIALLGALLVSACASTRPEPGSGEAAEGMAGPLPARSHPATVDEHLLPSPEAEQPSEPADVTVEFEPPESVWERLMGSFALPACDLQESSRDWAAWYAAHPDYLQRVFKRAEPWIYFITEELEFRGMPGELALLPIVESAYDPFAYSSGRALGTWQFISSTGRHYGLQQNWWYDGRRDVYASTHAALDYLQDLHHWFDGDWLLALASYNAGQGRVSRAIRRNERAGLPTDFWSLRLPRETRGYVPKLLGLSCLFLHAEQYGFEMPKTPDRQRITTADYGTQTDLVLVSQAAEVPIDVLFTLNPGFNRWATAPEGPHRLVLPLEAAARLERNLEGRDLTALMRWDEITVRSGDTLGRLAQVHQVPVSVIRSANGLDSDLIRVGQKLRLPRDERLLVDPLYAVAANELAELQSGLLAADRTSHTVRPGESLSVIARRYRVSVRDLQRWNDIRNPNRVRAGQKLTLFLSPAPVRQRSTSSRYTVRAGDSLWSIARKHKVKLADLMRWNGLDGGSVLQPGQSLKITF